MRGVDWSCVDAVRVRLETGPPATEDASDAAFVVVGVAGCAVSTELVVIVGVTAGAGDGAAIPRFKARYDR